MLLVAVMIASTFQIFALGVLASAIIDDLGVSRTMIGTIGAVNTGVGALTAPFSGQLTDRIGPRRAVLTVLFIAAAGLILMAVAQNVWVLLLSGVISGVPQGWGNPATNALIASAVEPGGRGTMTGIKQSGVTLAVFLAGAALPSFENSLSWQGASGLFALAFSLFFLVALVLLPRSVSHLASIREADSATAAHRPTRTPLPAFVYRLSWFALLMGLSSGAIGRFLALYAEEDLGFSTERAGVAVALSGLLGMAFRIGAARLAESRLRPDTMLVQLAGIGLVSCILLALAAPIAPWLVWPGVVLYALGHTAWNAVANLAIIMTVSTGQAGRASGLVMFGFLTGLTVSSPITGFMADTFESYAPAWWTSGVFAIGAAAILWPTSRQGRDASLAD